MEVVESRSSLKSVMKSIDDLLKDHSELVNTRPTSLLPKEVDSHMDKLLNSQDPDALEAKKFFMTLFDPDSLKLNASLVLLVTKACGFDVTPNHQLLCESVQDYLLGHVLHVAVLNVNEYTPSTFLCSKVATFVGHHFLFSSNKKMAQLRFYPVYSLLVQALAQSIESKFVKPEDVDSWITKHSQEFAMDGYSLKSAVLLGDPERKEEAGAAFHFGINFSLIRCIKKELQEFEQNKENNNILLNSLPVLHAFAGREEQMTETTDLLQEVIKMKGVEKTIAQMKELQEKALKSLKIFATDPEICQVLENLVTAYLQVHLNPEEKDTGM